MLKNCIAKTIVREPIIFKKTECESIHTQNLQFMLVEVYKSVNNIGNKLGWNKFEIIPQKNDEDENNDEDDDSKKGPRLRRGAQIKLPLPKTQFA